MNLALIPLLLVALLMAGADPGLDRAEVLWDGRHEVVEHEGVLIVGDADVVVPAGAVVPGPVYVIGGHVTLAGEVAGDVVQLAGVLAVGPAGAVAGELREIAGTSEVSPGATIGRRTTVTVTPAADDPASGLVGAVLGSVLLAVVAALASRRASRLLTIATAVTAHPVITATVGVLVSLTVLAVVVFMAFTLVLIPVAVVGLLAAGATTVVGVAALGHAVGRRLPTGRLPASRPHAGRPLATGLGTLIVATVLQLVAAVPLIGDLVVLVVLAAAFGAVLVTYLGLVPLEPRGLR